MRGGRTRWCKPSVIVAVLCASSALAAASPCDDEAAELHAHLERAHRNARRWDTAWAIGLAGAASVQLALAFTETSPLGEYDQDFEETLYVGATKATLGVGLHLILPLKIRVPDGTTCAELPALRAALAEAGRHERNAFFLNHLGGFAVNLTGAAILASRRSLATGAVSFALGFPVGLAATYTMPRASWHRWREQRATWTVGVSSRGAWLAGSW
jgi:hypothetical protein